MTREIETPRRTPRTLPELLAEHERLIIIETLVRCGGSRTLASRILGISRKGLYDRIRRLRINLTEVLEVVARANRIRP